MLIQCSRCRAVFSLQDGVASAGTRFKVQCGRCRAIFEAVATPKGATVPPPPEAAAAQEGPAEPTGERDGEILDPGPAQEWTPEPAETVVKASGPPPLALAPGPDDDVVPPVHAGATVAPGGAISSRRRWAVIASAVALAVAFVIVLRARGHGATVEEMLRQGRELLLRDDRRSLEEATKLFTDAARAAPGQAVPEAERAFALLLQAGAAKDLARRGPPKDRDKQERQAAKLLQQGAAAARQALSDGKDEPVALRAAALADAVDGKAADAAARVAQAESAGAGDPWVLYVKGAAAVAGHDREAAVQAYASAQKAEPRMVRADVDLAGLSLDGGDKAAARTLLEKVLRDNPQHDRAKHMLSSIAP